MQMLILHFFDPTTLTFDLSTPKTSGHIG